MDKKFTRTFVALCLMYLNSAIYAIIAGIGLVSTSIIDLWAVSHYIVAGVFCILYTAYLEKGIKGLRSARYWLINISAVAIIFLGYIASSVDLFSLVFCVLLSSQLLIFAISLISIVLYNKTAVISEAKLPRENIPSDSPEEIAELLLEKNQDSKSNIIRAGNYMLGCILILIPLYFVMPLLFRYSSIQLLDITIVAGILLIGYAFFNERKNRYFSSCLKNPSRTTLIELVACTLGLLSCYYFNGIVYRGTGEYPFYIFLILGISAIPFLITSKRISEIYVQVTKKTK